MSQFKYVSYEQLVKYVRMLSRYSKRYVENGKLHIITSSAHYVYTYHFYRLDSTEPNSKKLIHASLFYFPRGLRMSKGYKHSYDFYLIADTERE